MTTPISLQELKDASRDAADFGTFVNAPSGNVTPRLGAVYPTAAQAAANVAGLVYREDWATATTYVLRDLAKESGIVYICLEGHLSGTFSSDLAAGRWTVYQGVAGSDLALSTGSSLVGHESFTAQEIFRQSTPLATYDLLRTYAGNAVVVSVGGRTHYFDSAHGEFAYDASDTTSADDGGTILVDGLGRRWKRQYSGRVNVKWFGASGSGIADDTAAYKAASIAANGGIVDGAGPGGVIFAPKGVYLISRLGLRDTVVIGEDRDTTILKCNTDSASPIYFLDAATDRDGVTSNTSGGGGFQNLTVDGNNKTNVSGARTYGGGVIVSNMKVTQCQRGLALGLPIWANVKNVYAYGNASDGFYTYSGPGDLATSTTFQDCWADNNGGHGFYITQLTYSSFVNCSSQANALRQWNVDGSANGVSFIPGLQFIGCATEGGTQNPFYFKRVRELTIVGPRCFSPPSGYDLMTFDDCTGSIVDFDHSGSLGANYMLSAINHTGGDGAICLVGGNVTYSSAISSLISSIGINTSLNIAKAFQVLWNNATAAQRVYSQIANVDGYTGLSIYANDGTRLASFRRIGTPIFSTNGAISTPSANLNNGDVSFYVDTATSKLKFVCRDGSGNVKTADVTLV